MHQRPFDFKHWVADTRRLTPLERGIYFDMLAEYYTSESALPEDLDQLCRLVGAIDRRERAAVELVRDRYWTRVADGIIQIRTAAEILMGRTIINNRSNKKEKVPAIGGAGEAKQIIRERLANARPFDTPNETSNGRQECSPKVAISSANLVSIIHDPESRIQHPKSNTQSGGGDELVKWSERIVAAYPRKDHLLENQEHVLNLLRAGESPAAMLANVVRIAAAAASLPNGGTNNIFVWTAENFWRGGHWKEPAAFELRCSAKRLEWAEKNKGAALDGAPPQAGAFVDEPEGWRVVWPDLFDFPPPEKWLDVPATNKKMLTAAAFEWQKNKAAEGEP